MALRAARGVEKIRWVSCQYLFSMALAEYVHSSPLKQQSKRSTRGQVVKRGVQVPTLRQNKRRCDPKRNVENPAASFVKMSDSSVHL